MTSLCIILFLAVGSLWFFAHEFPLLLGMYVPACAVKRGYFRVIVTVSMLVAALFCRRAGLADALVSSFGCGGADCQSVYVILLSALIMLAVLRMFGVTGSVLYALFGSFGAYVVAKGSSAGFSMVLSILIAPMLAFVIAVIVRLIFHAVLDRRHIHLITLSYYMRIAVILCLVMTAVSVGLNIGGGLLAGIDMITGSMNRAWPVVIALGMAMILLSSYMHEENNANSWRYNEFTIYTVLSVGIAVVTVLVFFSFGKSAGMLRLSPAPLSVSSLFYAALAGCEVAQGGLKLVDTDDFSKEAVALILAPAGSLLIAWLIFYVAGSADEHIVDFTVISAAVLVLVSLCFIGYTRKIRRQRTATEKLVSVQQQQIYENSRALNDMELKVILSENQALHNSIEMKRQEVMNVALSIVEQREYIESLDAMVKKLAKSSDESERNRIISELGASLKQRLSYESDVDSQYFYAQAESLHEDFNYKLSENFPSLTQHERRLATLLRLGFSSKYIATLMNITPKSVEISRYRLRQKLGLSKGDNLVNFIKSI